MPLTSTVQLTLKEPRITSRTRWQLNTQPAKMGGDGFSYSFFKFAENYPCGIYKSFAMKYNIRIRYSRKTNATGER